ncbi:MAG: Hsp20/alpha crystallin family protein [Planctomycetia bacterium]
MATAITKTEAQKLEAQKSASTATEARAGAAPAQPEAALTYQPNVDICDCGAEVLIVADIPGARTDGIDVSFEDGVLSLHAKVPPRDMPGRGIRQEYGIGDYRRSFRLGDDFDASQITADYRHGVLTIHVPRLAAVRPRKVEVRAG